MGFREIEMLEDGIVEKTDRGRPPSISVAVPRRQPQPSPSQAGSQTLQPLDIDLDSREPMDLAVIHNPSWRLLTEAGG